jgi:hypothetical protein
MQAVGNDNLEDDQFSDFVKLPGVMAVGGYECSGGRWIVPENEGSSLGGSSYGQDLEILGPAADNDLSVGVEYQRMVFVSNAPRTLEINCDPGFSPETFRCFGGTSAAAPHVASVAALVLSYAEERPEVSIDIDHLRKILKHTAEDVLCDAAYLDPTVDCDCNNPDPECAIRLLGWDKFTGYGRADAGRALTLPVGIVAIDLDHDASVAQGSDYTISWEAFDINTENGDLDNGTVDLDVLIPDGPSAGWYEIADSLPVTPNSYVWTVPDGDPDWVGEGRRIRLRLCDDLDNCNQDYSVRTSTTVRIQVLSVSGSLVRTLTEKRLDAGRHAVDWDGKDEMGRDAGAGVYFVHLRTPSNETTARVVRLGE